MASDRDSGYAAGNLASAGVADALALLGAHLAVAQPDLPRVREALACLAALSTADPAAAAAPHARLADLLRTARNPAVPLVFDHLLASLPATPNGPRLAASLLRAGRSDLAFRALADLPELLGAGLRPDAELAAAVDELAARTSPAVDPVVLARAASALLESLQQESSTASAAALLESAWPRPVRLLAARVLDGAGLPPAAEVAQQVLGPEAYRILASHLAYTRATHRELVELTPAGEPGCPCAGSVAVATEALGEARLGQVLAELRWARIVWGVVVEPVVALSLGERIPVFVRPAEASLLERCAPARRAWEGHLITAFGAETGPQAAADAGAAEAVRRFRSYNLRHAELLTELMDLAPVTRARLRRILALLDEVTRDFEVLFAGEDPEAARVAEVYATLRAPLASAAAAGEAEELVAADVARQVQRFEDPPSLAGATTLHGLKRYLHQRGLRNALRRFRSGGRAERTVDLVLLRADEAPVVVQRIRYADLEPAATSEQPPAAIRLIVDAFQRHLRHGGMNFPAVLALLYGSEVQVYVQYRNHPAFVRLDLSPPRRGGMIDLEYFAVSQYELAQHPARDVPAIRTMLARLGFHVQLEGLRLHARYDKEAAADTGDLLEHAAALFALLPHLMDLDWVIASLPYPRAARELIAAEWAELFLRLGALPVPQLLMPDRMAVVTGVERDALGERLVRWDGEQPYDPARWALLPPSLGVAVRAELERRGWGHRPGIERAGEHHRALERLLLEPLRAAVARGELVDERGELNAVPGCFQRVHEARQLAFLLLEGGADLRAAAALGERLRQLERELPFHVTGSINGWPVELGTLATAAGTVGLAWLRDEEGVVRLASAAADAVWYRVRPNEEVPWGPVCQLEPEQLLRRLLAENCLSPDRELERIDTEADADTLLGCVIGRRESTPESARAAVRSIGGRAGSPGRASGYARIRPGGAIRLGAPGVLLAPDIGPADAPLLRAADAVVSTGGGVLSHIGLLALELGKPSLIVAGEWLSPPEGSPVLLLSRPEFTAETHEVGGLRVVCRTAQRGHPELVRDGDLVVVDGDRGELQLLGSDHQAVALHDGLGALADVLVRRHAHDADPLQSRGDLIRIMHQLEKLVARLQRPELAEYLVQELCLGPLAHEPNAGPQRRRLWAALGANHFLSHHASLARQQLLVRIRDELQRASVQLHELLPVGGVLELLHARLLLRRAGERLLEVTRPEEGVFASAPDPAGAVVRARLESQRQELRAGLAPSEPWRMRHQLVALQWLDAVLPPGEPRPDLRCLAEQAASAAARALEAVAGRLTVGAGEGGLELAPAIGSKAAGLGECARVLGAAAVPSWFVITDHAFRQALHAPLPASGRGLTLAQAIEALLRNSGAKTAEDWDRLAARIRQLWREAVLPGPLEAAIIAGYRALAAGGESPFIAVRSSALEEDAPDAAWAGEFDTFLCVRGERAVLEHVRLAWAGLWNSRALQHRHAPHALPPHAGGGIIIQGMVPARVAGVVQTVCAASGRLRELVVNAALGLGEGVVTGTVGVDEIRVHKPHAPGASLQLQYRVGDKRECIRFDVDRGTGTRRESALYHQRLRAALEYTEIDELVQAALALEAAFFQPLDIEFAFADHRPLILQARPIPLFHAALRETIERAPLHTALCPPQPELNP